VLASSLFVYMKDSGEAATESAPHPQPQRAPATDTNAAGADETAQSYDFYDRLPKFEVVVPERDKEVKRDVATVQVDRPGVYVLQAGSYPRQSDAERVQAQLGRQGIQAIVQRVAVDNDVWHRVRIGPLKDLAAVNHVRAQLRAADIDALLIRVGD
jgi:cell division protein FtsN